MVMGSPIFVALGKEFESWIELLERTADEIDMTEQLQKFRNGPLH
jgi:truncated hemoglobin YjbI